MTTSTKTRLFKRWVFWTGTLNIAACICVCCPFLLKRVFDISNWTSKTIGLGGTALVLPANVNNQLLIVFFGLLLGFLGITLIMASFEIEKRAWFVFWSAWLKIVVCVVCFTFVFARNASQMVLLAGVADLVIGGVYLYGVYTIEGLRK